MSETVNPGRLELLGHNIHRLEADLHSLRDEAKLNQKQLELHTERIALHEAQTASRLDQMSEILFAIADKLGVEYRR